MLHIFMGTFQNANININDRREVANSETQMHDACNKRMITHVWILYLFLDFIR